MSSHAKRHHFVPQRVVRQFAAAEASSLVAPEARDRVREHDAHVLALRDRASKWPVIVAERANGITTRVRRSTVLKVMQRDHLYGVTNYTDPVDRGIAAWLLHTWAGERQPHGVSSEDGLRALGEGVHLPSLVEERILAPFDGRWSDVLHRVESKKRLTRADITYLRAGLHLAQMRSPTWQSWAAKRMRQHLAGPIGRVFGVGETSPRFVRDLGGGVPNQRIGEILLDNDWVFAVAAFAQRENSVFIQKRIRLIHAFAGDGARFILPDSPVRPFVPSHPQSVLATDNLGFARGDTVGVYPISPHAALIVSASTALPSHRVVRRHLTRLETHQLNLGMLLGSSEVVVLPCLDVAQLLASEHQHILTPTGPDS